MDSLVAYGSDEDNDYDRGVSRGHSVGSSGTMGARRREEDANYDNVNMDMSEDSESEPELPPAESDRAEDRKRPEERMNSRDRDRRDSPRDHERRDRRRSPPRDRSERADRGERKSPRREERHRSREAARRPLLGARPEPHRDYKAPAPAEQHAGRSQDARDAVSPRFTERRDERRDERHERDRDGERRDDKREKERDRERQGRRERRSPRPPAARYPPPPSLQGSREGRPPPSGEFRPSYKVNKKLEAMEKMGLQIKTPSGGMATAQQLRAASLPGLGVAPHAARALDQVQKRKLLWANKNKSEAEEAAKWSNTRFAQDTDGRQASKFMRLMGIKDPEAVKQTETKKEEDPIKKQEELFQAMQAQYEVARATTHTMRGVGLGFQRGHV